MGIIGGLLQFQFKLVKKLPMPGKKRRAPMGPHRHPHIIGYL